MESSELTSLENISALREKLSAKSAVMAEKTAKTAKRKATPKKPTPPAKRSEANRSPPTDNDADLCIICLNLLTKKLTSAKSITCNTCKRPAHLKCADMRAGFYTCKHCDSDLGAEDEENSENDE